MRVFNYRADYWVWRDATPYKIPGVYMLACPESGKKYIGSAVNIAARTARHFSSLMGNGHHSKPMQADFAAYGLDAFRVVCLVCALPSASGRDLRLMEQECMDRWGAEYNSQRAARAVDAVKRKTHAELAAELQVPKSVLDQHKGVGPLAAAEAWLKKQAAPAKRGAVVYQGLTVLETCRAYGVDDATLRRRIAKGVTGDALVERRGRQPLATLTYKGVTRTRREWAARAGVSEDTLKQRLKRHTLEKALGYMDPS